VMSAMLGTMGVGGVIGVMSAMLGTMTQRVCGGLEMVGGAMEMVAGTGGD